MGARNDWNIFPDNRRAAKKWPPLSNGLQKRCGAWFFHPSMWEWLALEMGGNATDSLGEMKLSQPTEGMTSYA